MKKVGLEVPQNPGEIEAAVKRGKHGEETRAQWEARRAQSGDGPPQAAEAQPTLGFTNRPRVLRVGGNNRL